MEANSKVDGKGKSGMVKFKIKVEKLHKSFSNRKSASTSLADDVKEGHFAVIAEDENGSKRIIAPLSCLTHPCFLKLLEQAADEYGFGQEGVLTVPCRPSELERILADEGCMHGEILF